MLISGLTVCQQSQHLLEWCFIKNWGHFSPGRSRALQSNTFSCSPRSSSIDKKLENQGELFSSTRNNSRPVCKPWQGISKQHTELVIEPSQISEAKTRWLFSDKRKQHCKNLRLGTRNCWKCSLLPKSIGIRLYLDGNGAWNISKSWYPAFQRERINETYDVSFLLVSQPYHMALGKEKQ